MRRTALLLVLVGLLAGLAAPSHADVRPIPSGSDVDYQLGGPKRLPAHVGIIVRDRTEKPAAGRYNVCYVNGFQTQPDAKRFWRRHWSLVLKRGGRPVVDEAWGEWLLDLRTPRKRQALARIVGRWTAGCASDGFDAVEYDNLDSFTRSQRLIKRRHAVAFARLLVRRAHAEGLAAGQKNLADYDGTAVGFDFAVSEECGRYAECGDYVDHYGDQVLMVEYRRVDFRRACRRHGDRVPVVLRDRALSRKGVRAWC
ncbi:endo alpha-1,4 polygalactosaminidase [Nocardioides lijunqiniae]|uniref:endo alpha-1,4 polygalactosaminidase n=1 Tax=Nocardioides lijunqiniae TaxID=2760832 RepID=UPI001877CCCE|nr:endo alpha-1,4 polygalactosaminidase [Nocardioides lijunqiniae]